MDKADGKLRLWGEKLGALSDDERHELRKALKTVRYGAELFGQAFEPEAARVFCKSARKLQKGFGALNDAASAALLPMAAPAHAAATAEAMEWCEAQLPSERAATDALWERYLKTPAFWRPPA